MYAASVISLPSRLVELPAGPRSAEDVATGVPPSESPPRAEMTTLELARLADVQPRRIEEWARQGLLPPPVRNPRPGRRGRGEYRFPDTALCAARSLRRWRRNVRDRRDVELWLWLEGFDHVPIDAERVIELVEHVYLEAWERMKELIPSLPGVMDAPLRNEEKQRLLDDIDARVTLPMQAELLEDEVKARLICLLAGIGLVARADVLAWEESIRRERDAGRDEASYLEAVVRSFARQAGVTVSDELITILRTPQAVEASAQLFSMLSIPRRAKGSVDLPRVREIWQALCADTDPWLDASIADAHPFLAMGCYARKACYRFGPIVTIHILSLFFFHPSRTEYSSLC